MRRAQKDRLFVEIFEGLPYLAVLMDWQWVHCPVLRDDSTSADFDSFAVYVYDGSDDTTVGGVACYFVNSDTDSATYYSSFKGQRLRTLTPTRSPFRTRRTISGLPHSGMSGVVCRRTTVRSPASAG